MKFRTAEVVVGLMLAGLLAGATLATAQEEGPDGREERTAQETAPSAELLEFLGEWETDEGHWIDPTLLEPLPVNDVELEDETRENE
jgi:hypothetical protein